MVAGRDGVHAVAEKFVRDVGRDAVAAGGIFAVGDDDVEAVLRALFRQQNFDGVASGMADDVADEQNFHRKNLTAKESKDTKENQTQSLGGAAAPPYQNW